MTEKHESWIFEPLFCSTPLKDEQLVLVTTLMLKGEEDAIWERQGQFLACAQLEAELRQMRITSS
jgi:hypothetical protein